MITSSFCTTPNLSSVMLAATKCDKISTDQIAACDLQNIALIPASGCTLKSIDTPGCFFNLSSKLVRLDNISLAGETPEGTGTSSIFAPKLGARRLIPGDVYCGSDLRIGVEVEDAGGLGEVRDVIEEEIESNEAKHDSLTVFQLWGCPPG